jgi:hypothetical protein
MWVPGLRVWYKYWRKMNEVLDLVHKALLDYTASGMYLSRKFHKQYGKIGLQTYGQTHLKQEGINAT